MSNKIKVMIVDDSLMTRKVLKDIIEEDPELELVGSASDGKYAIMKIAGLKPDIVTLDVVMPDMDGLSALEKIMEIYPTKVIMLSSLTTEGAEATLKALELGAVDFIAKPSSASKDLQELKTQLILKIKALSTGKVRKPASSAISKLNSVIDRVKQEKDYSKSNLFAKNFCAIGISTGGPNALKEMFVNDMPTDLAYLIVQHMPASFTPLLASRLNSLSNIDFKEAEDGLPVYQGCGYVAPGDKHLEIINISGKPHIKVHMGEKVSGHRPSADVLFRSFAKLYGNNTIAIIMTGMGRDGADGIKELKDKGAKTVAQDGDSSVVFGMNKEAIKLGAIDNVLPLQEIPKAIRDFHRVK